MGEEWELGLVPILSRPKLRIIQLSKLWIPSFTGWFHLFSFKIPGKCDGSQITWTQLTAAFM